MEIFCFFVKSILGDLLKAEAKKNRFNIVEALHIKTKKAYN